MRSRSAKIATASVFFILLSSSFLSLQAADRQSYIVQQTDSISFLCFRVYGRFSPEMVKGLSPINSHVKDWDNLTVGQAITFLSEREMDLMVPLESKELLAITFLRHPVRVRESAERVFSKARLNMTLAPGDRIQVEAGGRAELMMTGGRVIRLDEGSALEIASLSRDQETKTVIGRFKLFLGRLWGKILKSKIFRKREMYVSSSTLVAGVRGTAYDLRLMDDQSAVIMVFEGEVEVYNPLQKMPESGVITDFKKPHKVAGPRRIEGPRRVTKEQWDQIILKQYQQITVTKEGISKPITFDYERERQAEWIRWNELRDLRLTEKQMTPA